MKLEETQMNRNSNPAGTLAVSRVKGAAAHRPSMGVEGRQSAHDRFEDLAGKLIQVSKDELDQKRQQPA